MQPEHRIHVLVIASTLIVMYIVTTNLVPHLDWLDSWKGVVVAYVATFGAYKTVHWIVTLAFNNFRILRWLLYRDYYIEGTWTGYYYGDDEEVRYFVDTLSQRVGEPVTVEGNGYKGDEAKLRARLYASWSSVASGFYNGSRKFIFIYTADVLPTGQKVDGITTFTLSSPRLFSPPSGITGHSQTVGATKKLELIAEKFSHKVVEADVAYNNARDFYRRTQKNVKGGVDTSGQSTGLEKI